MLATVLSFVVSKQLFQKAVIPCGQNNRAAFKHVMWSCFIVFVYYCHWEIVLDNRINRIATIDLSSPKPGHTTGRSGRRARRAGGAGSGWRNPLHPSKHREHVAWTSPQKHEQAKSYVNPLQNKTRGCPAADLQFRTGLSAVYTQFINRTGDAHFPCFWPVGGWFFISVPVESKTRTYHGQFGSALRAAERRGAAGPGRTGCRWARLPGSQRSL